jgi:UPF0716 protein FxsA
VGLVLFLVFIVVPIAELYVIVQVADLIGVLETIALLIVVSIVGTWLMKQQGMAVWRRLRTTLEQGRMPGDEVSDGAMILFGGALLLTPGFLTDILGLILLFPPTRAVIRSASRRTMNKWMQKRSGAAGVYNARVVRIERDPTRTPPTSSPSEERPEALEDGSPDKG